MTGTEPGNEMNRDDDLLEEAFTEARRAAPLPSAALMARVLGDAEAAMPRPAPAPAAAGRGTPRHGLVRLLAGSGTWGAFGGLATAAVAGLWVGYAGLGEPGAIATRLLGTAAAGAETTELLPGGDTVALLAGWEG